MQALSSLIFHFIINRRMVQPSCMKSKNQKINTMRHCFLLIVYVCCSSEIIIALVYLSNHSYKFLLFANFFPNRESVLQQDRNQFSIFSIVRSFYDFFAHFGEESRILRIHIYIYVYILLAFIQDAIISKNLQLCRESHQRF